MRQTRVRPMVEGGLLAAIAIIFAVISAYLPLIGPFVNLLWPVPIILLGVRHGYKWSILANIVAGIIIAMLIEPLEAISVVVGFGLIGIVLGYAFRRNFSPSKTMLWGSIASLLSKVALMGIGIAVTGVNPFNIDSEMMNQAVQQVVDLYRSFGIPAEELTQMTERMQSMIVYIKIILPAGFVLASIADTFLNFLIAKAVLRKLGHHIGDFKPFKQWTLPDYIVYFFALSLVMIYWGQSREIAILYHSGMNLYMLASIALFLQGMSVFNYVVDKYNLSRWVRSIILMLILTNGFLSQLLVCVGAIDIIIDYRRLRTPRNIE